MARNRKQRACIDSLVGLRGKESDEQVKKPMVTQVITMTMMRMATITSIIPNDVAEDYVIMSHVQLAVRRNTRYIR